MAGSKGVVLRLRLGVGLEISPRAEVLDDELDELLALDMDASAIVLLVTMQLFLQ